MAVFARPEVARSALELQDAHGLEVNPLLFGVWLACTGRRLGGDVTSAVGTLARIAAPAWRWQHDVVRPLRSARRALKTLGANPTGLYARLKALELDAEREVQWLLEAAAGSLPVAADVTPAAVRARALRHVEAGARWMRGDWTPATAAVAARLIDAALAEG